MQFTATFLFSLLSLANAANTQINKSTSESNTADVSTNNKITDDTSSKTTFSGSATANVAGNLSWKKTCTVTKNAAVNGNTQTGNSVENESITEDCSVSFQIGQLSLGQIAASILGSSQLNINQLIASHLTETILKNEKETESKK